MQHAKAEVAKVLRTELHEPTMSRDVVSYPTMLDAVLSKAGAPCELLLKATTKDETMEAAITIHVQIQTSRESRFRGKPSGHKSYPFTYNQLIRSPPYIRSKGPAPMQDGTYKGTASRSKGKRRKVQGTL